MKQYQVLLRSILDNGTEHRDRTGVSRVKGNEKEGLELEYYY